MLTNLNLGRSKLAKRTFRCFVQVSQLSVTVQCTLCRETGLANCAFIVTTIEMKSLMANKGDGFGISVWAKDA